METAIDGFRLQLKVSISFLRLAEKGCTPIAGWLILENLIVKQRILGYHGTTPYESTSLSIHRSKDWKNEKGPWAVPSEGPQQLTLSIRGGEPVDTSVQIDDDDDDDDDYGFLVLLIVSH